MTNTFGNWKYKMLPQIIVIKMHKIIEKSGWLLFETNIDGYMNTTIITSSGAYFRMIALPNLPSKRLGVYVLQGVSMTRQPRRLCSNWKSQDVYMRGHQTTDYTRLQFTLKVPRLWLFREEARANPRQVTEPLMAPEANVYIGSKTELIDSRNSFCNLSK